jgi:formylglycine-generating enzyme required for sulfatase activity
MVELPGVTESDLEELWAEGIETSIRSPMPRFKISDTVIPVGLYFTVMGRYPDLYKSYFPIASRRATQQRRWELYPDLPLTNTTVAEDQEFVFRLNLKTHRRFYIPNEQQVEYAIRGRSLREEGGFGSIIPTEFYFPGDEDDLPHHAWIASNSGYETHEVRAPLPSLPLENSTNTFGLIHPIGNVFVRSAEGVLRGGSFSHGNGYTRSSKRVAGFAEERERSIGLRIAEDF